MDFEAPPPRTRVVGTRFRPAEAEVLTLWAARRGCTVSQLIREAALKAARVALESTSTKKRSST